MVRLTTSLHRASSVTRRWSVVWLACLCAAVSVIPAGVSSQTAASPQKLYEAHRGDFDYLLGDWEFTIDSRQFGKGRGKWAAVRLSDGQILDEFRVIDEAGETMYVTTTMRAYNSEKDQWELVGMHRGDGLQNSGSGRRIGNEVLITQRTGTDQGVAITQRIRYYNIQKDSFSWVADQSRDGGKTWIRDSTRIEARRVGEPREFGPLTSTKGR